MTSVMSTPSFSLDYLEAVRDVQYQIVAAFSFLVWDFLLTFQQETEYIWRMRRCMFKGLYFYFRYFLFAVQVFHLAISPVLSSGRMPDFLCIIWYRYIVIVLQLSTSMIHVISATRIFALFSRSRKVGLFLGGLFLLDLGLAGTQIANCPTAEYFETCMLPRRQKDIAEAHTAIVMIVHSTLIGLVFFKHLIGARPGWGRTPLLSFLMRDAACYYVAVFLLCVIALAICGLDDLRVVVVFYWSISVFSSIGSRLVLNMEHFARGYPLDEVIQFTSHITV